MTLILTMIFGLAAGYIAAVLLYLVITIAITATAPHFVSNRGRFRTPYLLCTLGLWIICAFGGGYLATWLTDSWFPWLTVTVLAIAFAIQTWLHPIEAKTRFRGLNKVLMPIGSVLGVAAGYILRMRH